MSMRVDDPDDDPDDDDWIDDEDEDTDEDDDEDDDEEEEETWQVSGSSRVRSGSPVFLTSGYKLPRLARISSSTGLEARSAGRPLVRRRTPVTG
jgi:hypothetical protein